MFTFYPVIAPQGDGGYLIKPGKPVVGRRKFTVREAAALARVSVDTVLRLYDAGFIQGERMSPRKTMIFEDSLEAHLKATGDMEFWEKANRRQLYLKSIHGGKPASRRPRSRRGC